MILRKNTTITLSIIALTLALTGCNTQPPTSPSTVATSESSAMDFTEHSGEATDSQGTAETSSPTLPFELEEEKESFPLITPETSSTTENNWLEEIPTEDARPPIEITLPDETVPYTSFEAYDNMTEEEQQEFFNSFENPDDFFDWYNEAKTEYEKSHPPVDIGGSTNIDIIP